MAPVGDDLVGAIEEEGGAQQGRPHHHPTPHHLGGNRRQLLDHRCAVIVTPNLRSCCPQSFSRGGLYLKVNWLLWSMYDGLLWSVKNGLLWYMGHTSMSQFHTEWSHFWRQMVTIDYDGVSTHLMIILMIELGIWVIRACANFIRRGPTFGGKWLL